MEGYCMKCQKKQEMINAVTQNKPTIKGMILITTGNCKVCNSKVCVIYKEKKIL